MLLWMSYANLDIYQSIYTEKLYEIYIPRRFAMIVRKKYMVWESESSIAY